MIEKVLFKLLFHGYGFTMDAASTHVSIFITHTTYQHVSVVWLVFFCDSLWTSILDAARFNCLRHGVNQLFVTFSGTYLTINTLIVPGRWR